MVVNSSIYQPFEMYGGFFLRMYERDAQKQYSSCLKCQREIMDLLAPTVVVGSWNGAGYAPLDCQSARVLLQ